MIDTADIPYIHREAASAKPEQPESAHGDKPTLALFAHLNQDPYNLIISSGFLAQHNAHVMLISSDDLRDLIDVCDAFLHDLNQQRQLFVSRLNQQEAASKAERDHDA